jgi:hypothetical protein
VLWARLKIPPQTFRKNTSVRKKSQVIVNLSKRQRKKMSRIISKRLVISKKPRENFMGSTKIKANTTFS